MSNARDVSTSMHAVWTGITVHDIRTLRARTMLNSALASFAAEVRFLVLPYRATALR